MSLISKLAKSALVVLSVAITVNLSSCGDAPIQVAEGNSAFGIITTSNVGEMHNSGLLYLMNNLPTSYQDSSDAAVQAKAEELLVEWLQDSAGLDAGMLQRAINAVPAYMDSGFAAVQWEWVNTWDGLRNELALDGIIDGTEMQHIDRLIAVAQTTPINYVAMHDSIDAIGIEIGSTTYTGEAEGSIVKTFHGVANSSLDLWWQQLNAGSNSSEQEYAVAQGWVDAGGALLSAGFSAATQYSSNGSVDVLTTVLDGAEGAITTSFGGQAVGNALKTGFKKFLSWFD